MPQAISEALTRLSERERATLLAHEVAGQDTKSLGSDLGLTAGAVAAQLNRSRARLRVEYLLAVHGHRSADRPLPSGAAGAVRRRTAADRARSAPRDICWSATAARR